MTHTERTKEYVRGVLSGEIPACKQIRQACKRTSDHFAAQDKKDFPYYYDDRQAERVCGIIECFQHVKGRWAAKEERIRLAPWQSWIITSLYGWKRKEDGLRKYRRATLIIPRKQGKSLLAAALLLYHLLFDGEYGAECYCGASNLLQAKEIFSAAQQMLIKAAELRQLTGAEVNAASIVVTETNSKALPVIGTPKDGSNVSLAVCDETHQMRDLSLLESFQTGTGARLQPMIISVSTAGFGTENPCKQLQNDAEKILNGIVDDEELFIAIYTIDLEIDWRTDTALRMANPNYGVSVSGDYLRAAQLEAINNPTKYASFATKHLDITVASGKSFFSLEKWSHCKDEINIDQFAGEDCWMAFDLASKIDLAAVATVFCREVDGHPNFYVFTDCFAPEEATQNNPVYSQWYARGLIHVTEGNTIDYNAISDLILDYAGKYRVQKIGFDAWNAEAFVQQLTPRIVGHTEFVDIPNRATHLSTPMRLLQELTYNKRIHHSGDPVLTYCLSNVIAKNYGNLVMPDKEKPENKIDAAVATMMALRLASSGAVANTEIGFFLI
ncbi:MAG TPA: terminase TerL endonuclease subunit [Acidobacteriaceae bacterium]|nr:terminase TerL endonuclease subunit [Acidobacteriaceae bacterium]